MLTTCEKSHMYKYNLDFLSHKTADFVQVLNVQHKKNKKISVIPFMNAISAPYTYTS